jgi:phospholipid/cholesterol/gamma-HCH transport system permease protein
MQPAAYTIDLKDGLLRLVATGDWLARFLGPIDDGLRAVEDDAIGREILVDVSAVGRLDTAGAMVLERVLRSCSQRSEVSRIVGASTAHQQLIESVAPHVAPCEIEPARRNAFLMMTNRLGEGVVETYYAALEILSFVGLTLITAWRVFLNPRRLRLTSIFYHLEEAGLNAVPIVGLMSFLIGAVVAFMGAKILRLFNAEVFTVELVGISVLREFGVLLAAILVAGRSGSAFTAAIGTMKIREEIDALRALGLDPMEVLVLPRVIALIILMPVLAFLAALLGMVGGGLVAWSAMEISPAFFIGRLQDTIAMSNFWVGLIKAPFFAFVIAIIGCFQGMEVAGSSESLGQRTTLSVVQALFLVIILDAFFAMFFLEIDF